jgi:hypothetical protein
LFAKSHRQSKRRCPQQIFVPIEIQTNKLTFIFNEEKNR